MPRDKRTTGNKNRNKGYKGAKGGKGKGKSQTTTPDHYLDHNTAATVVNTSTPFEQQSGRARRVPKLPGACNDLTTVFEREPDEEVRARKVDASRPFEINFDKEIAVDAVCFFFFGFLNRA